VTHEFSTSRRAIVILAAAFLSTTCRSTTEPDENAPLLPPETSMVIGFDDFMSTSAGIVLGSTSAVGTNWTRSAVIVVGWNAILGTVLATPVAAFIAAASREGEPQEDGSWAWAYDFAVGGVSHSARLEGSFVPQGVQWNMFITKADEYSNFHWFSGVSNILATSGQWNLNLNPTDPTAFMQIDWSRNPTTGAGDIKYTNVIPGANENGAYIAYGLTTQSLDAFYEIFSAASDNMTSIEWNRSTKEGRVADELFYGDAEWHCWDGDLEDTVCSS